MCIYNMKDLFSLFVQKAANIDQGGLRALTTRALSEAEKKD